MGMKEWFWRLGHLFLDFQMAAFRAETQDQTLYEMVSDLNLNLIADNWLRWTQEM